MNESHMYNLFLFTFLLFRHFCVSLVVDISLASIVILVADKIICETKQQKEMW